MAVKVDKDLLLKHRFWILIGLFVILALVPLFLLTTSVSEKIDKFRADYDGAKKAVEGISSNPENEHFVAAYQKKDDFVAAKKAKMHEAAWLGQKDMMTYPDSLTPVMQGKYFGDPIEFHDLDKFNREYSSQLNKVIVDVQPLLPQEGFENGVVQFARDDIDGVLRLGVDFKQVPPSKEDFWIAQEDIWVKRELLRIIRAANDAVARFRAVDEESAVVDKKQPEPSNQAKPAVAAPETKPADGAPATPEKPAPKPVAKKPVDLNHRVFRNQHWELDLTLKFGKNDKKADIFTVGGTIKNIGNRRRALGIAFKVLLQSGVDPAGILLPVDREPLGVGESWSIPPQQYFVQRVSVQGLYGVEEVLTWRTAPVKRIDVIELDYSSSRMANRALLPPRWYTPPPVEEVPADAAGAGGPGAKMAAMGMTMGAAGGAPSSAMSKNGLILDRYIDTNEQVRHMPIGMVVVADDEHLTELLSAFTNSPLRIQVTQCHWQVCHDKLMPTSAESSPGVPTNPGIGRGIGQQARSGNPGGGRGMKGGKGGGEGETMGARGNNMYRGGMGTGSSMGKLTGPAPGMTMGAGGMQGMLAGKFGRAGMGGLSGLGSFGGGMPGSGAFAGEGDEEENLNLLEVAVYGLASIYERYPPKSPAPDGTTTNTAAGATGASKP